MNSKRYLGRILLFFVVGIALPLRAQQLPEGPGKKELQKLCGSCHGAEAVMGVPKMDRDGWQQKVFDMIGPGTASEQTEIKAIVDYLVRNLSPVRRLNVNLASAKDLETGLSLTPAAAEALVQYRQTNGNFKSIEDLKKALAAVSAKIADDRKETLGF